MVPGVPPIKEVEYQKHWITLTPIDGTSPTQFVDVSLFRGIKPNTTHNEALRLLGSPSNQRKKDHNTYLEYYFDRGRLEIGREEYASDGEVRVAWSLTSYPNNLLYTDVLTPAAAKSIRLRNTNSVIQICDGQKRLHFLLILSGERVESINWRSW